MGHSALRFSLATMLGFVACVAFNLWLFRVGFVWGLIGLNLTKHVGVAVLCRALGVNRRVQEPRPPGSSLPEPHASLNGSP